MSCSAVPKSQVWKSPSTVWNRSPTPRSAVKRSAIRLTFAQSICVDRACGFMVSQIAE